MPCSIVLHLQADMAIRYQFYVEFFLLTCMDSQTKDGIRDVLYTLRKTVKSSVFVGGGGLNVRGFHVCITLSTNLRPYERITG